MPKVSLIVPIYNSEQFLERCISSIINQTFKDFELILINDGSTDNSIDILRKYKDIDNRIIVIDNSNNGVSITRNIGIEKARGKYIQFVDSDDFIDENMLNNTISTIEKENSDLVITGLFLDIYNGNKVDTSIQTFPRKNAKTKIEIAENVVNRLNGTYINSPVNKLYKRELIVDNNLKMKEDISLGEDLIFNLEYLSKCKSVVFEEESHYHYNMKMEDNLTAKYRSDKLELMKILYNNTKEFLLEADVNSRYIQELNGIFIKWMYYCFIDLNMKDCKMSLIDKYRFIRNSININKDIISDSKGQGLIIRVLKVSLLSPIIVIILSKIIYFIKSNLRRIIYK